MNLPIVKAALKAFLLTVVLAAAAGAVYAALLHQLTTPETEERVYFIGALLAIIVFFGISARQHALASRQAARLIDLLKTLRIPQ